MDEFDERFKKLYYKKGRRYKEYARHREIPQHQLYFLDNGEFVPYDTLTMDWYNAFSKPANGIWKVFPSGATKIAEYEITDFRIELEKYRDMMLTAMEIAFKNSENKYISRNDVVSEIFDQLDKLKQKSQNG
jgi:hypothetical protein